VRATHDRLERQPPIYEAALPESRRCDDRNQAREIVRMNEEAKFGEWQPIETAPIDETVFCYHPMVGRFPGYQSRIDGTSAVTWHNTWSQESGVMPPTLWQPLPEPPTGATP
jgi:hypothetical protein